MLTITYAPDGATAWSSGIVLCATSRSLSELDVQFNHKRSIGVEQLAVSLGSGTAALAQDFANWRHTLSLKVRRGVDFSSVPFPDPEGALAFALQQPASFPAAGALQIKLAGVATNAIFYLLNCGVETITYSYGDLGAAPAFQYSFNGGLISLNSPF